jgi:hypothetical protein
MSAATFSTASRCFAGYSIVKGMGLVTRTL